MQNPWPGLSSYTEESEYQFNGRSAASASLSALIRRNLFVTLYGRSGIGKTSLLQAGVYPLLREDGLCPVTIRLNGITDERQKEENKKNVKKKDVPAKLLWDKLLAELNKREIQYAHCDESDVYTPDFTDVMVLRSLFSAGRFYNADNEDVTPVIVLDQFEEVLYNAPAASRLLISQLYALIDDNYNLTIPHPTWHEDTIFRIVVSIREDDLFLFEDCIDTLNCVDFKSNRYRLMPLNEQEAEEVILAPETHIFAANEKDEIVKKIIKISRNKGESINTLMLSLLCHVLYDKYSASAKGEPVKLADLADYDDIIKIYYQSILKERQLLKPNGKPKKDISWLEDNLIDEQGRRKSVYISDLKKNAPEVYKTESSESEIEGAGNNTNHNRLLNISQGRAEFIHDQLAASVFKIRLSRKTTKYRRNGIIIMSIVLAIVFLYAFTYIPEEKELKEIESSLHLVSLSNNTKVTEYTIEENDSLDYNSTYEISDCPNLKTINIKKKNAYLKIYHCPNLVTINYPDNYKGNVTGYNCPNLVKNEFCKIDSLSDISAYDRDKESELGGAVTATNNSWGFIESDGSYSYYALSAPYYIGQNPSLNNATFQAKFRTGLSDEHKHYTDCYVPWGHKDMYSQLREFQAFRSIKTSLLSTLRIGLTNAYNIYKSYGFWFTIGNCIIFFIGYLFFLHYMEQLRLYRMNAVIRVVKSILYSLLTLTVCLLAYLSFYWFYYRILFENKGGAFFVTVSNIIGITAALWCMGIILKPDFWTWLKNAICSGWKRLRYFTWPEFFKSLRHGAKRCLRIIFSFVKRHLWGCLLCILICVILSIVFNVYQDGKDRRERYLYELSNLDIAKVSVVIDALEKQHGSILYPFFTDSLNSIKRSLNEKLTSSVIRITPGNIKYIARSKGIDLYPTDIFINAISNDGYGLCIKAKNEHYGTEQMVYYNILSNRIDTITAKNNNNIYYKSVFSPSGKTLICYTDDYSGKHGFIYNVDTRELKKMPEQFPYAENIIMTNDNNYYYRNYDYFLYKGSLSSNKAPSAVRNFEKMNFIHLIDSENIGFGKNEYEDHDFIIYNLKQDSIIYRSKKHDTYIISSYGIRGINSEYVVSSNGVFDLKKDSLIVDSDDMYMWNNRPIEIKKEDNKFVLRDINGKVLKTIIRDNDDSSYSFEFRNNYIYSYSSTTIYIYNLRAKAKLNRNMKINDHDKKVFDLE